MELAWIDRIWSRFSATYAHKFVSLFQTEGSVEIWRASWAAGLTGVTAEQIKYALEKMLDHYAEWPPGLGQFRQLCQESPKPVLQALPEPKRVKSAEQLADLMAATKPRRSGPFWTIDRVVNQTQVDHVVRQALHFGDESPAGRFLGACIAAGAIVGQKFVPIEQRQVAA